MFLHIFQILIRNNCSLFVNHVGRACHSDIDIGQYVVQQIVFITSYQIRIHFSFSCHGQGNPKLTYVILIPRFIYDNIICFCKICIKFFFCDAFRSGLIPVHFLPGQIIAAQPDKFNPAFPLIQNLLFFFFRGFLIRQNLLQRQIGHPVRQQMQIGAHVL